MAGVRPRLLALMFTFVATACASDAPPTDSGQADGDGGPPPTTCSASEFSALIGAPDELPPAVIETRRAIAVAAVACDYEALEDLGISDGEFVWTFSDDGTPAEGEVANAWRASEAAGDPVLASLVQLLQLPHASRGGDFVWPSAFADEPTVEDWEALRELYTVEEIQAFREFGGYAGLRVGISSEGEWQYFVAGD